MDALFDRLAGVALGVKLGVLMALLAAMGAIYYVNFYQDLVAQQERLAKEGQHLQQELSEYKRREQEYLAFRNEVNALLEEQKELLRVLPKADDIEQFIESVQAQVELSGLSKVSSVREGALPVEMYLKIPVRMSLTGSYHQINRFFKNVGDLKRIVNIEDLQLQPADAKEAGPQGGLLHLKANFVATTFQFLDKAKQPAQRNVVNVPATVAQ
jgi:type IV pilus assembly protein PilO